MKLNRKITKAWSAKMLVESIAFSLGGCLLVACYLKFVFMLNR